MADGDDKSEMSFDAIVGALNERLRAYRCPVCQSNQFALLEVPDENLRTNIHLFKGPDPIAKKHIELLTVACTNCGHLEQFVQKLLRERLLAQKGAS